ncbi:hypothetical protein AM1_E0136 (plasmid) [Acaryochloris marina MBIC11017]|uniref:Uncharacterized protein n=1 Tax=Acaryochloris marina (strain MBIC 11017) TaxID=329726 RepID=A8ZPG9_ACAM1|nr:hypothetical protein AM1_E0136 [Acaryochloris marina MBIC11017]
MTKKIRKLNLTVKEAQTNHRVRNIFGNICMIFVGLITFG